MARYANAVNFVPTLGGTTDFVVASAVQGFNTPALANMSSAGQYKYRAESADLSQWEIGLGTWNGSTTLARTTVLYNSAGTGTASGQTGAGTKISFAAAPNVGIVVLAEELIAFAPAPQGRLTLATNVPVMPTSQAAKTTIYYTPYLGNVIPIYDGFFMVPRTFTELSVATTDTTKSPAAIGASKVNDWFVWDDAGTLRLSHGPDWTNDTTRSAGTVLSYQRGLYLNSVAITNGPGAFLGTYVGTTRSNASSSLDWIYGSTAALGGAAFLNVWNAYNRRFVATTVMDSTVSYTYTSATFRSLNNSTANRVSFVLGLAEDGIDAQAQSRVQLVASGASAFTGIAMDGTSTPDVQGVALGQAPAQQNMVARKAYPALLGAHFVQQVEASDGTNANNFVLNGINQTLTLNGMF